MITNPIYNNFHIYFSQEFLIPEVEKMFERWFERQDMPFLRMIGLINNSIINADVLGISTQVQEQTNQNGTKRSYSGGLSAESSIPKKLSIQFKVQNNYFSYFVMRQQIKAFIDRWNKSKDYFLPHITLDILDDYGSIIFTNIYHEIVFESISGLSFKKSDVGISYKEFTCNFRYNKIEEFSPLEGENYIDRKQEYIY